MFEFSHIKNENVFDFGGCLNYDDGRYAEDRRR